MKKAFFIFAFALLGITVFTSCSKEEEEEEPVGGASYPEKIVMKHCKNCHNFYDGHPDKLEPCPKCGMNN